MADPRHVLVVGAGPAGLAAAVAAAISGARVTVVDENLRPGGQIWRPARGGDLHRETRGLVASAAELGVERLAGRTVFDASRLADGTFALRTLDAVGDAATLSADAVVLATGATERFLPFPGWTIPGVVGVGGLQALVKGGLEIANRRVLIAGSGPLLLAVAGSLLERGATVTAIVEQAPRRRVLGFGTGLVGHPAKLRQALALGWQLRAVPKHFGAWVTRVTDDGGRLTATIRTGRASRTESDLDYVACGYGLVPATGLAELLGCHRDTEHIAVDEFGHTSVDGVLCAGETTGIGGVDVALAEGRVAGHAAAGDLDRADDALPARARELDFAARLERAFRLDPRLAELPEPDTIVCRCEDVAHAALVNRHDTRQAKLETRCGMGPCQGRVCGPAVRFLFDWPPDRVRPPLLPVPMRALRARPSLSQEPTR